MNIEDVDDLIVYVVKQKQGIKLDDLFLYMTELLNKVDLPYGGINEYTKIIENLVCNRRLNKVEYTMPETNKTMAFYIPVGGNIYITAQPNFEYFDVFDEVKF